MNSPRWWSQPMRPEGDNTGSGIKNQLGRPRLGEYAVLVREAVQNSWDARLDGKEVSFSLHLKQLGNEAATWRECLVDGDLPENQNIHFQNLSEGDLVLLVSDRGTTGLGGPIRNDEPIDPGVKPNFTQFMRNFGESRDTFLGGGTFGFGKGIYYRLSEASAILVDSRNTERGERSRRLMGAAIGEAYSHVDGTRYTGRHWWGKIVEGVPDPLLGAEAEEMAERLGLPGFKDDETGTDIAIILPSRKLEEGIDDLDSLVERLRAHLYWNLWSKFSTPQRPRGITFSVKVNDRSVEMPRISDIPVIADFADALDGVASRRGTNYKLKKYEPRVLGEFITSWVFKDRRYHSAAVKSIVAASPLEEPYCHIARMRQAELVVDYLKCQPIASTEIGYVGVFRATADSDDAFAAAEPPTHDDWATGQLTGDDRGIVQNARTFINERTKRLVESKTGARSRMVAGLGKLSNELGAFINSETPNGHENRTESSHEARSGSSSQRGFRIPGSTYVTVIDGTPVVEQAVELGSAVPENFSLEARAVVLLANGQREASENAPLGGTRPEFIGWFSADNGELKSSLRVLTTQYAEPGNLVARFTHVPGAAVKILLENNNV